MPAQMTELPDLAQRLRELHEGPAPLVLPNAWDAASARTVERLGFPAVATTSGGVAEALGWSDGEDIPPQEMLAAVERIAGVVQVPVTADLEGGYGLEPADLAGRLLATGAVGCNIEDTDHHGEGPLLDPELHAERLAAIKEAGRAAGVDLVLNARVDVYVRAVGEPHQRVEEALRRGRLYRAAGADSVYPIGVAEESDIRALVEGLDCPVNVMLRPNGPELPRLAELGVSRVSIGSGLFRVAMQAAERLAASMRP
jgi:2-methylisocitrate lyase-like PEP mutase family enzyme